MAHLSDSRSEPEKAWCLNGSRTSLGQSEIDKPLSDWNEAARNGELPAIVLNATVAETGERVLLATTKLNRIGSSDKARVDSNELHNINGEQFDVGVVTAARLSATFPYVTPASRSDGPGPQPHLVDGGYYDNYGMATLVEWLDQALQDARESIEAVLVIQIHGASTGAKPVDKRHEKARGWFYQFIAPVATLVSVRNAGQVAHNDIELELLQQKWAPHVRIDSVKFVFPNPQPPLSWHLVPEEQDRIRKAWIEDKEVDAGRTQTIQFLTAAAPASAKKAAPDPT